MAPPDSCADLMRKALHFDHGPHLPAYRDAIRAKLGDLAALQHQCAGQGRAIRQAADARLTEVQRELHRLMPRATIDDEAGERYRALILERARLHRLLS